MMRTQDVILTALITSALFWIILTTSATYGLWAGLVVGLGTGFLSLVILGVAVAIYETRKAKNKEDSGSDKDI